MKRIIFTIIMTACLAFSQFAAYADNSEMDTLVDMLVQNGSLTREQANILASKAKEKAAKQAEENAAKQAAEKAAKQSEESAAKQVVESAAKQAAEKAAEQAKTEIMKKWEIADNSTKTSQRWRISDKSMQTRWDNGLVFETVDGDFKAKIGGRIYADMLYVDGQSSLTDRMRPQGNFRTRNDQAFISDARIGIEGTIYKNFFYKLEYDFYGDINSKTQVDGFRGAYMGMKDIPYIGKITIGQMKEPFSLEELASENNITFLERALPNVFAPGYQWGLEIKNNWFDERLTFAIGAFRNSTHSGTMSSGNEWCSTARLTCLPWYEAPDKLVHLGASYSFRLPESGGWNHTDNEIRFWQIPELLTRDYIVDTGNFNINAQNLVAWEGAAVYGPVSVQGELMQTWLSAPNGQLSKTGYLYGGYGYISYIITGEHRIYDKSDGRFKGVEPKHIFSIEDHTWGAWEVAARYSCLNLDDKSVGISGGIANDITLGLNWYLNPNMRLMINYVYADRAGYGSLNGIQTRAQVNFD